MHNPVLHRSRVTRCLALVTTLALLSVPAWAGESFTAKVRDVSDGDTLVIKRRGGPIVVQLHGIDAPELSQEYGHDARDFVRELTAGKRVTVEVVEKRGHGVVARLTVDGKDLAQSLVSSGLAWASEGGSALSQAQEKAKAASDGLWAARNPTAPWDHRASS